jgi:hypothetical protein
VIWSEKRWILACFGVKNGLFLRFFPVKSSAFNTVRGKRGGGGGFAAFWPSPVGRSVYGYCALVVGYFTQGVDSGFARPHEWKLHARRLGAIELAGRGSWLPILR